MTTEMSVVEYKNSKKQLSTEVRSKVDVLESSMRLESSGCVMQLYVRGCIYMDFQDSPEENDNKTLQDIAEIVGESRSSAVRALQVARSFKKKEIEDLTQLVNKKNKSLTVTQIQCLALLDTANGDRTTAVKKWKEEGYNSAQLAELVKQVKAGTPIDDVSVDEGSSGSASGDAKKNSGVESLPKLFKRGIKASDSLITFLQAVDSLDLEGVVDADLQTLMTDLVLKQKTIAELFGKIEGTLNQYVTEGDVIEHAPAVNGLIVHETPKPGKVPPRKAKAIAYNDEIVVSATAEVVEDVDPLDNTTLDDLLDSIDTSDKAPMSSYDDLLGDLGDLDPDADAELGNIFGDLDQPAQEDAVADSVTAAVANRSLKNVSKAKKERKTNKAQMNDAVPAKRRGRPPKVTVEAPVSLPVAAAVAESTGPAKNRKRG